MATKLNGTNIEYTDGTNQFTKSPLVKTRYTSHPTVNLSLPTWGGETDVSPNIDMGVPQKSNNWYRCEYYNITDDWPGSGNGGMGLALYRYTPSSGWLRAQAQGQHANYDNGDDNTGGGAGATDGAGTSGGSGVVILRYPSTKTISIGAGLTHTTDTQGSNKVTVFTQGTGDISWS